MESKVIVLTPRGRRVNVKVTPNTTLLQILEEVCEKHGFDSNEYCLKHYNKDVPMSQMFRFTGLPNNCLLEMSESDRKRVASTSVDICIQYEDGTRKQAQFKPEDNVWYVVTQLTGKELPKYENPVIIYTRQEIFGEKSMSQITLKSLGILEGRALMRLLDKKPEELKSQANVYKPSEIKEENKKNDNDKKATSSSGSKSSGVSGGFAVTKNLIQNLKNSDKEDGNSMDVETPQTSSKTNEAEKPKQSWDFGLGRSLQAANMQASLDNRDDDNNEEEPEYNIIGERNAIIYSLDAVHTRIEDLPDSFYDLTVNDLKLILRDLKNIAAGNEDAPLLTEKLREFRNNETMLHKISQYKSCIIRIQFPDRFVLQGIFKPVDKVTDVIEFVKQFLKKPEIPFYLFTIPPKTILESDVTLLALDLVPNALIHFSHTSDIKSEENYLKQEFLQKLTTPEAAIYAANKFRRTQQRRTSRTETRIKDMNDEEANRPGPSTGAIPKRPRGNGEVKKT